MPKPNQSRLHPIPKNSFRYGWVVLPSGFHTQSFLLMARALIRPYLFLFAVALSQFTSGQTQQQAEFEFDREQFGRSELALWSDLSPFEAWFLHQAQSANLDDGTTLLALYWIAAGTHRDEASFQAVNQELNNWLASKEKALKRKRKLVDKAKVLHDAMHTDFFKTDDDGNSLIGYDADQSQLTHIFSNQEFNCISSTMLYLVLARKLNWDVDAVLLPSHTYVQLYDNNKIIEIETTSIHGFNIEHDQDFYDQTDQQWFSDRDLEPTSYEDYLNREIISAFELGLFNMWSQHTRPERMTYRDRFRLAELRGYLSANDHDAQLNRLNFYQRELGFFNRSQLNGDAKRFLEKVSPYIDGQQQHIESNTVLKNLWLGLQTEIALHKVQSGELFQGLNTVKSVFPLISSGIEQQPLLNNLMIVLSHYVVNSLPKNDYANLRLSLIGLEDNCINNLSCSNSLGQLYANWAQQFWDDQDWRNAARVLSEYIEFGIEDENTAVFISNAETAFVNEAKLLVMDGDWKQALDQLSVCENTILEQKRCSNEIKSIERRRHMGNL